MVMVPVRRGSGRGHVQMEDLPFTFIPPVDARVVSLRAALLAAASDGFSGDATAVSIHGVERLFDEYFPEQKDI